MDACVMAAQVLANCVTGEATVPPPRLPQPQPMIATAALESPQPTPATAPTSPETAPAATPRLATTTGAMGGTCSDWGMPTKPKDGGSTSGCTALAPPPVLATGDYPASLPLHPEQLIRANPTTVAVVANAPTVPLPTTQIPSPTPQVSRALMPQTPSQPTWASQPRPVSGSQMYQFRSASLRAGEMYTRANPQRYATQWQTATTLPSHQDWQALLQREAAVMAQSQGRNRLTVVVGDSLALWLPSEDLPQDRFWLNQSISGETTAHMLRRLHYFANTRPDTIHVMAGINDLKNGASDAEVVGNLQQMVTRLRQQHPQAKIIVYSILPTRWDSLPSDRIRRINARLAYLTAQQGAFFADLQPTFADGQGQLRRELTTDGLHLSRQGYEVWRAALVSY